MIAVRAIVPVLLRPRIAADAEDPRFLSANSGNELLREKIDFFRRTGIVSGEQTQNAGKENFYAGILNPNKPDL